MENLKLSVSSRILTPIPLIKNTIWGQTPPLPRLKLFLQTSDGLGWKLWRLGRWLDQAEKCFFFYPAMTNMGCFHQSRPATSIYLMFIMYLIHRNWIETNTLGFNQPQQQYQKKMSRDGRSEMVGKPMETQIQPSMAQTISPWVPSQHSPGRDQKYQPWNMSTQQIYKLSVHYVMLFVAGLNRHKSIQLKKQL